MPTLDSTAKAAAASPAFSIAHLVYLDIAGDPLRFTTFGADTVVSGSGDAELDGTYIAFGGRLIDVSDVSNSESGSDTLSITLSGIVTIDNTLLNEIADRTKWQTRAARIWTRFYDDSGQTAQGAIAPLYTGYMSSVKIAAAPESQTLQLDIENWLAAFNMPSNRSYMNQKDYDSGDNSAAATLAASNGQLRTPSAGNGASGGSLGSIIGGQLGMHPVQL